MVRPNRRGWARIGRPRPYYYRLARFCARVPLRGRLFDWSVGGRGEASDDDERSDEAKKSRWEDKRRRRTCEEGREIGAREPRARKRGTEKSKVSRYKGA